MKQNQDLATKLEKIKRVFDISDILDIQPDKDYVRRYYKINKLAYSLFHTFSDRMYMGISRDGQYKNSDLLEAARFVEKYIPNLNAKNILDLATGRGATSSYLAQKYPAIRFDGIDISEGQLDFAAKKAKKLSNYHPIKGDYHNLSHYHTGQFDIVFVVEALCYSQEKEKVLKEVYRILKPGGGIYYFRRLS